MVEKKTTRGKGQNKRNCSKGLKCKQSKDIQVKGDCGILKGLKSQGALLGKIYLASPAYALH